MQMTSRQVLRWLTLAFVWLSSAVGAQETSLRDLMDRLEYAYYTADARALLRDLSSLEQLQETETLAVAQANVRAYGRWKLAQLTSASDPSLAETQALACADGQDTKRSPIRQENAAQATQRAISLSLSAACWRVLEQLRPMRSVWYRKQRTAALTQAEAIQADAPAVRLVRALVNETSDLAVLQQVVAEFDAAALQGDVGIATTWGHAEACFLLGRAELTAGNLLAARNALQRALVLAPDYSAARELLRSVNLR